MWGEGLRIHSTYEEQSLSFWDQENTIWSSFGCNFFICGHTIVHSEDHKSEGYGVNILCVPFASKSQMQSKEERNQTKRISKENENGLVPRNFHLRDFELLFEFVLKKLTREGVISSMCYTYIENIRRQLLSTWNHMWNLEMALYKSYFTVCPENTISLNYVCRCMKLLSDLLLPSSLQERAKDIWSVCAGQMLKYEMFLCEKFNEVSIVCSLFNK